MRLVRQRTTNPSRLSEAGPSATAEKPTLSLVQASTNPVAPLPSPTSTEHLQGPTILITISDDDSSEHESVESHSEDSAAYEELMTTEILAALKVQEVNEVRPLPLGDHVPDIDPTTREVSHCPSEDHWSLLPKRGWILGCRRVNGLLANSGASAPCNTGARCGDTGFR
ncbi:uncharacterized protein LOC133716161 [Rosa rugosa]|uniref:uncharacterized protein LOC133716161 n=1 Tax=Rosa rugosa TaxID=74645 RepID=UPI002B416366|nr:uncharacterized protein LOC133716161 [Rosa rugosa]